MSSSPSRLSLHHLRLVWVGLSNRAPEELVRRYSNRADLQERLAQAHLRASERGQAQGDHTLMPLTLINIALKSYFLTPHLNDSFQV